MSVQIVTDSLRDEAYRIGGVVQATPRAMRDALTKAIIEVEREAKKVATSPGTFKKRTGRLARSLSHEVVGNDLAVLTVGVEYGMIQDRGGTTRPHRIEPRFKKALAFPARGFSGYNTIAVGKGINTLYHQRGVVQFAPGARAKLSAKGLARNMVVVRGVNHPGSRIPAVHYSRTAFENSRDQVEWIIQNALALATKRK